MSGQKTRPTALDWGLLGLLGLIWGGAFLGVEMGLDSLAPLWVSTGRIVLAAVVLTAITFIWGDGLPGFGTQLQRRIWLHCFGMGMFTNAIPFSLLAWGQQIVSSGFAGITMAVVPLLVLPLSHFLIPGERLTPARLVGFLIGFAGVVLLIGGDRLFSDMAVGDGAVLGAQMACVAASCCYACGSIITRLCPPVSTMSFAAAGLICASLVRTRGRRCAVSGPAADRRCNDHADGTDPARRTALFVAGELSGACLGCPDWRCHSCRGPARTFHHGAGDYSGRRCHFAVCWQGTSPGLTQIIQRRNQH